MSKNTHRQPNSSYTRAADFSSKAMEIFDSGTKPKIIFVMIGHFKNWALSIGSAVMANRKVKALNQDSNPCLDAILTVVQEITTWGD